MGHGAQRGIRYRDITRQCDVAASGRRDCFADKETKLIHLLRPDVLRENSISRSVDLSNERGHFVIGQFAVSANSPLVANEAGRLSTISSWRRHSRLMPLDDTSALSGPRQPTTVSARKIAKLGRPAILW